jgi:GNAT superfamily N-acetyltransferase
VILIHASALADLPDVVRLLVLPSLTSDGPSELRYVLERADPGDRVWIAREDRIVGWCAVYRPIRGTHAHRCLGVFVYPEHRRQGIGRNLVETARAETDGELRVATREEAARKLFARVDGLVARERK